LAEVEQGPVMVARSEGGRRLVFVGFALADQALEGRLATPLLFANLVRWFAPGVFRGATVRAAAPGLVEFDMPAVREEEVQIRSSSENHVPWRLAEDRLRFFAGRPGRVSVRTPDQEIEFHLDLPGSGDAIWTPPSGTREGVPPPSVAQVLSAGSLWPWLCVAALAVLLAEWRFWGRVPGQLDSGAARGRTLASESPEPPADPATSRQPEEQLTR
jgi:hypothetical protein